MTSTEKDDAAFLTTALNHAQAWFQFHATQRLNFMNYFVVALAFLSAAYVGALTREVHGVAAGVCLVGIAVSTAFFLLDLRNRELTRAGERPLRELQGRLATALDVDSLRIIEAIDQPRRRWMSEGNIIRSMHVLTIFAFILAGWYALRSL
jgi:hypothetical protein